MRQLCSSQPGSPDSQGSLLPSRPDRAAGPGTCAVLLREVASPVSAPTSRGEGEAVRVEWSPLGFRGQPGPPLFPRAGTGPGAGSGSWAPREAAAASARLPELGRDRSATPTPVCPSALTLPFRRGTGLSVLRWRNPQGSGGGSTPMPGHGGGEDTSGTLGPHRSPQGLGAWAGTELRS